MKISDNGIINALRRYEIFNNVRLTTEDLSNKDFIMSINCIGPMKAKRILNEKNKEIFLTRDFDLICPYCGWKGEYCDFPDLFYEDECNTEGLNEQVKLLNEMWNKGFNIVTCGCCGQAFIHRTGGMND